MMSDCETYACVNLPWLYKNIDKRTRKAERQARKKFLAARKIQRYYREFRTRKNFKQWREMIILMQSTIRRNLAKKRFYIQLERAINKRTKEWHNYAATLIQKIWRGYITRLKVHDHTKMRRRQVSTAKDLIICIGYKLHHLLRTRQIPGIYSIRNSNILSRVEELLKSLEFKPYNARERRIREEKAKKVAGATEESVKSAVKTRVPYSAACAKFFRENDIQKMHAILNTVEPIRKSPKHKATPRQRANLRPKDVCDDVMGSMKRWNIVKNEKNLSVSPRIVSKPENIENFLGEIEAICHKKNIIRKDRNVRCVCNPSI